MLGILKIDSNCKNVHKKNREVNLDLRKVNLNLRKVNLKPRKVNLKLRKVNLKPRKVNLKLRKLNLNLIGFSSGVRKCAKTPNSDIHWRSNVSSKLRDFPLAIENDPNAN